MMNEKPLILLVEDNPYIMEINRTELEESGFEVIGADTVKRCRELLGFYDVDLIILDIMLPDGDGVGLCREIRKIRRTPILFVSALGESPDIVKGLASGGDDYLPKPYDLEILTAKVNALLRSSQRIGRHVRFEGILMNLLSGEAEIDGRPLSLTQKEFALLASLAKDPVEQDGENLLTKLWGQSGDMNALSLTISRLKQKLADSSVTITTRRAPNYLVSIKRTERQ